MIIPSKSCWVFDLDDTLYKELTYQQSGFNAISSLVRTLYKQDVSAVIANALLNKQNVFEEVCNFLKLPLLMKESLLWHYRLHKPDIALSIATQNTIAYIKKNSSHLAIVTDGRSISQKLKIEALNLSNIPAFVSEEWDEIKPGVKRFEHIMATMPANSYVYVGDNIKKDFITPNKLGWLTIGLKDDGSNIHSQNHILPHEYQPNIWVESLPEIKKLIC